MKVIHVINSLEGGGAERLVSELLPLLKKQNIDVELLVISSHNAVFDKSLLEGGVKITFCTASQTILSPLLVWKIKRYLTGFDIVHTHLFPTQYLVVFATMLIGKKTQLITTEHSTNNGRRKYPFLKPLEKFIYHYYDHVVSISLATQDALLRAIGEKYSAKFSVIENGIDIHAFSDSEPLSKISISPKIPASAILLIMVAGFNDAKDQLTVLKALKQLPDRYFLILAGDGPYLKKTQLQASKMGLDNKVCFTGFRMDIQNLLKTADIGILSSNWDGFGLSAIEAMAAGIPIVASNVEGLRECVSGAGVLFERANYSELAEKIQELWDQPGYMAEVIAAQNVRVKKYSLQRMAGDYKDLYHRITERRVLTE